MALAPFKASASCPNITSRLFGRGFAQALPGEPPHDASSTPWKAYTGGFNKQRKHVAKVG
eukprot:14425013-Alexandrium_andersonii.AAC.1